LRGTLALVSLVCCATLCGHAQSQPIDLVHWAVSINKETFHSEEAIIFNYEFLNGSPSELRVPRSVNPFMSVRFHFVDPSRHEMQWNGAQFSFAYRASDFIRLEPNGKIAGQFQVPAACPGDHRIEKGGYCFREKGEYFGTAEFRLGENAVYRPNELGNGHLAEGPYRSSQFRFRVQ
jgi:hypothetical protein